MTAWAATLPLMTVLALAGAALIASGRGRMQRPATAAGALSIATAFVWLGLRVWPSLVPVALPVVIAVILAGLWLAALGWRGRRVDDHPWCRKCGFDLFGSSSGAERCPECGTDLNRRRAVVIGRRRKRWVMFGAGMLIIAATFSTGAAKWWDRIAAIEWNWNSYKPDWWLMKNLRSADDELADAALDELVRRDEAGTLAAGNRAALIDFTFEEFVTGSRESRASWSSVVAGAWLDGLLTQERRLAYARLVAPLSLDAPSPVARNAYLPIELSCNPQRGGERPELMQLTARLVSVRLAGTTYDLHPLVRRFTIWQSGHSGGGNDRLAIPVLGPPGESTLETLWRIECSLDRDSSPDLFWEESLTAPITIAEPGPLSAAILTDEATAERIREAVKIAVVGLRRAQPDSDEIDVIGLFECMVPGIRINLYADIHHREARLGSAGVGEGWAGPMPFHFRIPRGREHETLDVTLTPYVDLDWPVGPSLRNLAEPLDPRPHWFGPAIHIRDVPVKWYDDLDSPGINPTIVKRFSTSLQRLIESWPQRRDE